MKASLFTTLVILAAGGLLGWQQHGRLLTVRETHLQVTAEAQALGLSPTALLEAGKPPLATKTSRTDAADKLAEAKALARELIDFAQEMKKQQESGEQPDPEFQKRIMELLGRFMDLGPAQLKAVIADLKASEEIDDEMRQGIIGFAIMTLANDQPEAALALFTESADMKGMAGMGNHVVSSSLGKWAEKDPLGALEWVRANSEKHAALITEEAKAAILAGAAKQDPKLALGLTDDLEIKDPNAIGSSLARSAKTPEERDALLTALRGDKQRADVLKSALTSIGGQLSSEGFEASEAWLSSAKLSTEESAGIAVGISAWQTGADTGKWIDWMADKVPADTLNAKVDDLVAQWTQRDFKAAGEWVNGTAEGPAKIAAVKAFARTVAPYEPESALQWANTLPAGKERDELLETIARQKKPAATAEDGDIIWTEPDDE